MFLTVDEDDEASVLPEKIEREKKAWIRLFFSIDGDIATCKLEPEPCYKTKNAQVIQHKEKVSSTFLIFFIFFADSPLQNKNVRRNVELIKTHKKFVSPRSNDLFRNTERNELGMGRCRRFYTEIFTAEEKRSDSAPCNKSKVERIWRTRRAGERPPSSLSLYS